MHNENTFVVNGMSVFDDCQSTTTDRSTRNQRRRIEHHSTFLFNIDQRIRSRETNVLRISSPPPPPPTEKDLYLTKCSEEEEEVEGGSLTDIDGQR